MVNKELGIGEKDGVEEGNIGDVKGNIAKLFFSK